MLQGDCKQVYAILLLHTDTGPFPSPQMVAFLSWSVCSFAKMQRSFQASNKIILSTWSTLDAMSSSVRNLQGTASIT